LFDRVSFRKLIGRRRRRVVFAPEALVTGPPLEQRAVDGEVLVRQQLPRAGHLEHLLREGLGDVALEQPVAVLGKRRRIPDGLVGREADEPPVEEIVVELLHELPFAPDGVEDLEQQGAQQPLGWDRRSAERGVHLLEARRERDEHGVDEGLHGAQRVVGGNAILDRPVAKEHALPHVVATHRPPSSLGSEHDNHPASLIPSLITPFSAAC